MKFALLALAAVLLAGCGYVGDPLPPALNIPAPVEDLRVIQRGDKLLIDFTAPALTTEAIGLTSFVSAEILAGESAVTIPLPKPGEASHAELPARQWIGKELAVRVVLGGPKGRKSAESNVVTLRVTEPLGTPVDVRAEPHPEGVRVSWKPAGGMLTKFRVTRTPAAAAVVDKPEHIDKTAELGKEYSYTVTALTETGESLASAPVPVLRVDVFAPPAPSGLNVIAGVGSIELAWDRNPEADLQSYRVYRDGQVLADGVETPSFSDRQVTSGQKYRYAITAVDRAGNESTKSVEVEVTAP